MVCCSFEDYWVIGIWFSFEWGCDVGDLECEMTWISRDMEGMIITCGFHDSDWISIISDADRHYFRVSTAITLSPMPLNELWGGWEGVLWVCGTKRGVTCLSVISWSSFEELRCLFVREGWSEYLLGLWRHPCSRMHILKKDTHRWDWACLNIIHSGWESLSRVMWRGYWNVEL